MTIASADVYEEAQKIKEDLITWRRHLHQNPELGFEEKETSKFVQGKLKEFGIEFKAPIAKTGVLGIIRGTHPGPTVALRADMDALPIQEENEIPYKSKVPGVAHLCGHDAHTTILLGVAKVLSRQPLQYGTIKFLFQPAEEGLGGAREMVKAGVLQDPKVDVIAGLHVHSLTETGYITVTPGIARASTDMFKIEIIGTGGHAAHPHLSVDTIPVAAEVISSLQQVISRNLDPLAPGVLTIGKIEGGYRENVIAPSVRLAGTVRLLSDKREMVKQRIETVVKGVCEAFGASYKVDYEFGYPPVFNDESLVPLLEETANDILGEKRLLIVEASMSGEDFSYYANEVPGIFFRLGTRNEEKGCIYPNHHPKANIDEDALPYGVAMLSQFALNYIEKNK